MSSVIRWTRPTLPPRWDEVEVLVELLEWSPRVQVVDLTPDKLTQHFDRNSAMAWSIRRGLVLSYGEAFLARLREHAEQHRLANIR